MAIKEITKKEFKAEHSNGKMVGVTSQFKTSKEELIEFIAKIKLDISEVKGFKTTRVDLDNNDEYCQVKCYKAKLQGFDCYFVESTIDNSKSNTCSMVDKTINTIMYKTV